jgi:hypothetical protein
MYASKLAGLCAPCKPAPVFKMGDVVEGFNNEVFRINLIGERHGSIVYAGVPSNCYNLRVEEINFRNGYDLKKYVGKK